MLFDVNKGKLGGLTRIHGSQADVGEEKDTFSGHPRPLNCAKFCKIPSYGHLLITGSTEGTAKIWASHSLRFPGVSLLG